jgi:hypothetical protein
LQTRPHHYLSCQTHREGRKRGQRQTAHRAEADRLLWPVFCGENKTGKTGLSRQKQTGKKTGKKAGEQTGKKTGERTRQT